MSKKNIVSQSFRDKFTGDYHSIGSEYGSDDPERIKELEKMGFLKSEVKPAAVIDDQMVEAKEELNKSPKNKSKK